MTTEEHAALVRLGETEHVETKRSTAQRTEAAKSVCAMLSHCGGREALGALG